MKPDKYFNGISAVEIKKLLEEKYLQYNNPSFIDSDPVSIPHMFSGRSDREIAGFLAATISWGRRDLILRSGRKLLEMMGNEPYRFILSAGRSDLAKVSCFVHRTFNGIDCGYFMQGLKHIYSSYSSMEDVIVEGMGPGNSLRDGMDKLRKTFFSLPHASRNEKHFADIKGGAAGKRLNMFLRIIKVASNQNISIRSDSIQ